MEREKNQRRLWRLQISRIRRRKGGGTISQKDLISHHCRPGSYFGKMRRKKSTWAEGGKEKARGLTTLGQASSGHRRSGGGYSVAKSRERTKGKGG